MKTSNYFLYTIKETPSEAKTISHILMLRAGLIRKVSSGTYNWLPTGIRVLQKIKKIIRAEMNLAGAIEIYMTKMQPKTLWEKSGRLKKCGLDLFRVTDRNNKKFILSPTNEELITDLIRNEIVSYKNFPLNLYQIQTKFRDEIRPRFGVIRSREFIMKDAYSFHTNFESLKKTYKKMYKTYIKIFNKLKINFKVVEANNGDIGGIISHEFQTLGKNEKDKLILANTSNDSSNINLMKSIGLKKRASPTENIQIIKAKNISELKTKFKIQSKKILNTIIVNAKKRDNNRFVALVIRNDHSLNKTKTETHPLIEAPLKFATTKEIKKFLKIDPNALGPINLNIPIIVDYDAAIESDFVCGSNIKNQFYFGANWIRDIPLKNVYDFKNINIEYPSLNKHKVLNIQKGIEIGHIFQLGNEYSSSMKLTFINNKGFNQHPIMGCYGIGITRIIAAIIEQNYDDRGIIWPNSIAPFQVAIIPINMHKSNQIRKITETVYDNIKSSNIDVLLDNRKESLGTMFTDIELIGIPHILIISKKSLKNKKIEYYSRKKKIKKLINKKEIIDFLKQKIKSDI